MSLHPDMMNEKNLDIIIGDLMTAYPNVVEWNIEYYNTRYNSWKDVYEAVARYSPAKNTIQDNK